MQTRVSGSTCLSSRRIPMRRLGDFLALTSRLQRKTLPKESDELPVVIMEGFLVAPE
ncbi:MAG: hypothetical protein OXI71_06630 [Gemmatimonadota bacterium]|nr:hypothetical protein [Gemmatimonadota bacterium]